MTINEWKERTEFLANKYQHGYISPEEFVRTANMSQEIYFERIAGQAEQFQYQRPVPRIGLGMGERIEETLRPFTDVNELFSVTGNNVAIPNVYKILAVRESNGKKIRPVSPDRIASYLVSSIEKGVFYMNDKDGLRLLPINTPTPASVLIDYLRKPTDVQWNYTVNIYGELVFNPTGSVNPQWNDFDMNQIIFIQLGLLGIHLKDADMVGISDKAKTQGE